MNSTEPIKPLSKLIIKDIFFNLIKDRYDKFTTNIMLNGKNLNTLYLIKIRNKSLCSFTESPERHEKVK